MKVYKFNDSVEYNDTLTEKEIMSLGWKRKQLTSKWYFTMCDNWLNLTYSPTEKVWILMGNGSFGGNLYRGRLENIDMLKTIMDWTGVLEFANNF